MKTWQIFSYALKFLPTGRLQAIYTRSVRLVQLWAADPDTTEHHERNPLDRIRIMLAELDAAGYGHAARAAIDILAAPLGGRFEPITPAESDKGTVDGEIADCLGALAGLAETVRRAAADGRVTSAELVDIREAARGLSREVGELLEVAGRGVQGMKGGGR